MHEIEADAVAAVANATSEVETTKVASHRFGRLFFRQQRPTKLPERLRHLLRLLGVLVSALHVLDAHNLREDVTKVRNGLMT